MASISMLQRRFSIGYNRAGRLIQDMEEKHVVSPCEGAKPRQVLITEEEYRKKANSDSVSTKPESDLGAGNNKETDKSNRKTELKRLKDQGLITEEEYLREIKRGE